MFQPLGNLFKKDKVTWQESDVKYFVQDFLRSMVRSDGLYCHDVTKGMITVRVNSPTLVQEVRLLEHDLRIALEKEATYTLRKLKIVT